MHDLVKNCNCLRKVILYYLVCMTADKQTSNRLGFPKVGGMGVRKDLIWKRFRMIDRLDWAFPPS